MTPAELLALARTAQKLHRVTHDPLLPSAIKLISTAAADAMARELDQAPLTPQQQLAVTMVVRMRRAHLTLFAFSPTE